MIEQYIFHLILISISLIVIRFRSPLSNYLKIIDYPDNTRKLHSKPTSCIGGLIIFSYASSSLIYSNFLNYLSTKYLFIWLLMFVYFFIVGIVDDRNHLNARIKTFFLLIFLFIVLPLDHNFSIHFLKFEDIPYLIKLNQGSLYFTIFCIFFLYNALNFCDGANGVAISLSLFILGAIIHITNIVNIFYISLAISLLLLLIPNLLSKIFIGNSGVNLISIIFSLIFINLYNENNIFFDQIVLLVFLPSIDMIRVILERIVNNESPLKPDQNHLHHLLQKKINAKYIFIPYLLFAITPYFLYTFFFTTYISIAIGIVIYFIIFFLFKNKNA